MSLGELYHPPPLPTKRPLPGTFALAEIEALAPRNPHPTDDESISDYFINSKRDEALHSIRYTDAWHQVKDDLIFCEFPAEPSEILNKDEVVAKYKDRPDPDWDPEWIFEGSPTPEPRAPPLRTAPSVDRDSEAMLTNERTSSFVEQPTIKQEDDEDDVLGNLEQALQEDSTAGARRPSRAYSTTSARSQSFSQAHPGRPIRDEAQEDILAALGVTGSPKMASQTLGRSRVPPPPPPPRQASNGYPESRRGSTTSQHTASGSDFETPLPRDNRADNLKRGYDSISGEGIKEEDGEEKTGKQRRKQPRVQDAYL